MKRNRFFKTKRLWNNSNRRRLMLKRAHQRMLQRNRLFNNNQMIATQPVRF